MNTAVEITFKNGDKKIFNSLEEAAINSGLSESAIKLDVINQDKVRVIKKIRLIVNG